MRIRATKPEFWKSRRVASVSWDSRLVLKGLESYVDDNGVGIDDIELIVTDVFPRDMFASPRETVARVSEAISHLHQAGLIHRYRSESDPLLYISFWESIQRIDKPGKGRYPRPDGTFDYRDSHIRESVASPPVTLAPGTGEQGNSGTGEQGSSDYVGDAPAPNAGTLIAEWIDQCKQRPPGRVIGQLSKEIKSLLDEGIPYRDVRSGVAAWHSKSIHPSTLASVVHEVRNPRQQSRPSDRQAEILRREMEAAQEADSALLEIGS